MLYTIVGDKFFKLSYSPPGSVRKKSDVFKDKEGTYLEIFSEKLIPQDN